MTSCSQFREIKSPDPFRDLYKKAKVPHISLKNYRSSSPTLSLSCNLMPFSLFARIMSDKFNCGLVFSETLSQKTITSEFKNTDLVSVLNVVSRQLGAELIKVGNTYYIGSLRPEDRAILVRRILGYKSTDLKSMIESMLSTNGKAFVTSSGISVVADHESVVRRVSELSDYLNSETQDTWILQLCFVSLRKDAMLQAGFDVKSSGTISYNISENSIDFKNFSIEGLLNLQSNSSFADVYASPMLLIQDGKKATWKDGKKIPIPKVTVSDTGTVSTTGYEYIETGFIVRVQVDESSRGGVLQLYVENSEITSFTQDAPHTTQSVFETTVEMQPLKPYFLGELTQVKVIDRQSSISVLGRDRGKTSMQIWGQLYKISGSSLEKFKGVAK